MQFEFKEMRIIKYYPMYKSENRAYNILTYSHHTLRGRYYA